VVPVRQVAPSSLAGVCVPVRLHGLEALKTRITCRRRFKQFGGLPTLVSKAGVDMAAKSIGVDHRRPAITSSLHHFGRPAALSRRAHVLVGRQPAAASPGRQGLCLDITDSNSGVAVSCVNQRCTWVSGALSNQALSQAAN